MLKNWMDELRKASQEAVVLVEGKRDREALQNYGVRNVYTLEGKRFTDLPDLVEGFEKVILLFDLDSHGERINKKVKSILSKQGYILIESFREELRSMGISYVEEINGKVRSLGSSINSG